jgi:hypothetical protein
MRDHAVCIDDRVSLACSQRCWGDSEECCDDQGAAEQGHRRYLKKGGNGTTLVGHRNQPQYETFMVRFSKKICLNPTKNLSDNLQKDQN